MKKKILVCVLMGLGSALSQHMMDSPNYPQRQWDFYGYFSVGYGKPTYLTSAYCKALLQGKVIRNRKIKTNKTTNLQYLSFALDPIVELENISEFKDIERSLESVGSVFDLSQKSIRMNVHLIYRLDRHSNIVPDENYLVTGNIFGHEVCSTLARASSKNFSASLIRESKYSRYEYQGITEFVAPEGFKVRVEVDPSIMDEEKKYQLSAKILLIVDEKVIASKETYIEDQRLILKR